MLPAVVTGLLAASAAFLTLPLKKRELPNRYNVTRSVRVGLTNGAPTSIVINECAARAYMRMQLA